MNVTGVWPTLTLRKGLFAVHPISLEKIGRGDHPVGFGEGQDVLEGHFGKADEAGQDEQGFTPQPGGVIDPVYAVGFKLLLAVWL